MSIFICKFCSDIRKNNRALSKHQQLCKNNPNRKTTPFHDLTFQKTKKKLNQFTKAESLGLPKPTVTEETRQKIGLSSSKRKHNKKTIRKISVSRKKFLTENPDKHPWKRNTKFVSHPCETVKERLLENNINFEQEWNPNISDRHFSIDIAFPDIKLGLEINGEQHYDRNGNLIRYYQERHNLIESYGWTLLQIHYKKCYDKGFIDFLIDKYIKQ